MAAEFISAELLVQSSADGNVAITVPADATGIVVCWTGYSGASLNVWNELNFDNGATEDFDTIIEQRYSAGFSGSQAGAHIITTDSPDWPGSGAKTLYYAAQAYDEGANIGVFYVKNIDTAAPIVDTEGQDGPGSTTMTSALTGVTADDLGVIVGYCFQSGGNVRPPAASGQTAIWEQEHFNSAGFHVSYETGESAMASEVTSSEHVIAAFALKASAAGPVLTVPTETSITQTTATIGCTTDTAGGTLYAYISTSATPPSIADLKAGTGAVWSGSLTPVVGANTFNATGLTASTTYYSYFIHDG